MFYRFHISFPKKSNKERSLFFSCITLRYHFALFPEELRGPLEDQCRRNFGDSFSVFFCLIEDPDRLNGIGMQMFFPFVTAPVKELSEVERAEEGPALKSSLLELTIKGLIDATELDRCVFSSDVDRP